MLLIFLQIYRICRSVTWLLSCGDSPRVSSSLIATARVAGGPEASSDLNGGFESEPCRPGRQRNASIAALPRNCGIFHGQLGFEVESGEAMIAHNFFRKMCLMRSPQTSSFSCLITIFFVYVHKSYCSVDEDIYPGFSSSPIRRHWLHTGHGFA